MNKPTTVISLALWTCMLFACGGGASGSTASSGSGIAIVPAAPTGLSAILGNASATISFNPPIVNGGPSIISYSVNCAANGIEHSATSTLNPITVINLVNNVTYTCTVSAANSVGTSAASTVLTVTPVGAVTAGNFSGNVILGTPTANSIKANIYSATQSASVSISYGTSPGTYDNQTNAAPLLATVPMEISIDGLASNTRYYYRLNYRPGDGDNTATSDEYNFHTARPAGSTFSFSIQGDSHPERPSEFNAELYNRTLLTAAADKPDFHITLGDDFSIDTLNAATITATQVTERYTLQRPYLGLIGRTAPVFLVNGNHEQSAGYLLDGTANNVAVWVQNARNTHYSQPAPGDFYTGNSEQIPHIGLARNYYAWTWGDALFVTIDPYLTSTVPLATIFGSAKANTDIWAVTHGDSQYQWLKTTLEQSKAKYKFVFAHHVMGAGRGGIEVATLAEWGGLNKNGRAEFSTKRSSWAMPIHQLMVANKVSIFFQGHDHAWVRQQLDGVTYQTLSEPANPNYNVSEWAGYFLSGDKFPNTGYTRVNVTPNGVKVDYVRTYLPADEVTGKINGTTAFSYTLP